MKVRKPFQVSVYEYFCLRCGHLWTARGGEKAPKTCPCCRSKNWDGPKIIYPQLETYKSK